MKKQKEAGQENAVVLAITEADIQDFVESNFGRKLKDEEMDRVRDAFASGDCVICDCIEEMINSAVEEVVASGK